MFPLTNPLDVIAKFTVKGDCGILLFCESSHKQPRHPVTGVEKLLILSVRTMPESQVSCYSP